MPGQLPDTYQPLVLVVIDVETNGPSVRRNSLYAVGGVAIQVSTKKVLGGFWYNLEERPGTEALPATMRFWADHTDALEVIRRDLITPREMARNLASWIRDLKARLPIDTEFVVTSDAAAFDMKWIDEELSEWEGPYLLGYRVMDLYSYIAGLAKVPRHRVGLLVDQLVEAGLACHPDDEVKATHCPYDDALYQAVMAVDVTRYNHHLEWVPVQGTQRMTSPGQYLSIPEIPRPVTRGSEIDTEAS